MKTYPLCAKKYSTVSLRTVNNFVIARMADALDAFFCSKVAEDILEPRDSNLVNGP